MHIFKIAMLRTDSGKPAVREVSPAMLRVPSFTSNAKRLKSPLDPLLNLSLTYIFT